MSDCERFHSELEAFVGGEAGDRGAQEILSHAAACEACRPLLAMHGDLLDLGARTPMPGEAEFARLRGRVLAMRRPVAAMPARSPRWWQGAALAAAAMALFAAGLAIGSGFRGTGAGAASEDAVTSRILAAIETEAAANRRLQDVEDSPFTYSNVSFREVGDGRVAIDFDFTTHLRVVESARSALAQEIVVQALMSPTSTGGRLSALSYAAGAPDPKVREALILAMHHDETLAVRLRALTILAGGPADPVIESAILGTLRNDEAVQMRLLALDYLAGGTTDRQRMREAITSSPRPGKEALQVRLAEIDRRL